eukprot:CAMPEP_0114425326 /NCGR_PEP_ID=MMETSP0103-20121206/7175_1 /TAXON_ID=37642 ORGANISM="Paraphysomonas imperforata, Strain PA2" /NCGR_SAMPLE_ID=MMETSP0103 /ASSEMBLY_ACC=CAM_ASM_000201 /LENGTH=344 /DNA_ID=CAMNT_0001594153 /DNA_START=48 /DNA_END=1082 /DNA_ORIENTATION=+
MYLSPFVTFHVIILADFFTPFSSLTSPWVNKYHRSLVDPLPEIPPMELYEIPLNELTQDELRERSFGFTTPVVIRGALADTKVLKEWNNISWWVENYGDEEVICKYVESGTDEKKCTIKEALSPDDPSKRMYVSGEARMFMRRPELAEMVKSELLEKSAPGEAVFTQLFMGYKSMGSDMHSALGCNLFRQIVGSKKWWLVPTSQTALVYPSLNPNGFSAHTSTFIGKGDDEASPWLNKLKRWEVVLKPGDVLLNPAWIWHGILNVEGGENDLSIGVPTRYAVKGLPAFRNNWLLSAIGVASISYNYGFNKFTTSADNVQDGIERARNSRAAEISEEREAMERAM